MFPLDTATAPTTTADWRDQLARAIGHWMAGTPSVRIDGTPPTFTLLEVDLTGCQLTDVGPPDILTTTPHTDRVTAGQLHVTANPMTVRGVEASFDLSATRATFDLARHAAGLLVATLTDAADGRLSVHLAAADVDAALLAAARVGAAAHGVDVRSAHATLSARSPHELDIAIDLTVKKFVTFPLRVAGRLSIDDAMTATATGLTVTGTGMAANVAAAALRPQLAKLDGKPLPLRSLPLGDLQLRGVTMDASDGLRITAAFGGTTA